MKIGYFREVSLQKDVLLDATHRTVKTVLDELKYKYKIIQENKLKLYGIFRSHCEKYTNSMERIIIQVL